MDSKAASPAAGPAKVLDLDGLDALIGGLRARGFTVVGPTVRSRSIVYGEVSSVEDLPAGWIDEQDGGTFRLHQRGDGALFEFEALVDFLASLQ